MKGFNVEIKAKCDEPEKIRSILESKGAIYKGLDHQIDTYFNFPESEGRLKIRQGNIENALVFYKRENIAGPKNSNVRIANIEYEGNAILDGLSEVFGVKNIIDKKRHIYFIDNVKFHIDSVKDLGSFFEIEAISGNSFDISREKLLEQCNYYKNIFGIKGEDLIDGSYSDLLTEK